MFRDARSVEEGSLIERDLCVIGAGAVGITLALELADSPHSVCVLESGGIQAEAAGLLPSVHMNPILLKPSSGLGSQVVLQGKVFGQMEAVDYHMFKPRLRETVLESYDKLAKDYEVIVMEGAGSCCEMNLKNNDLVNFAIAKATDAPCILMADIDRGGVFAQIRRLAPLLVPITINAIVGAEDIIDAMDLRCFGIGPRTWVHKLRYQKRDLALICAGVAVFVGALLLNYFVWKWRLWVPPFLLSGG